MTPCRLTIFLGMVKTACHKSTWEAEAGGYKLSVNTGQDGCSQEPRGHYLRAVDRGLKVCVCGRTQILRPSKHMAVGLLLDLCPERLVISMNRTVVHRHVLTK